MQTNKEVNINEVIESLLYCYDKADNVNDSIFLINADKFFETIGEVDKKLTKQLRKLIDDDTKNYDSDGFYGIDYKDKYITDFLNSIKTSKDKINADYTYNYDSLLDNDYKIYGLKDKSEYGDILVLMKHIGSDARYGFDYPYVIRLVIDDLFFIPDFTDVDMFRNYRQEFLLELMQEKEVNHETN